MIVSKTQREAVNSLMRSGGVVKSSDWTTGSGRYTTCRAVPPYCTRWERFQAERAPKHVQDFFTSNPKVQAAVAVDNPADWA